MALYRGSYRLAHMSQVLGRDEKAAKISRYLGREVHAYMLTDEQHKERVDGKPRTGLPYRFLVYSPESCALSWTAFYTHEELQAFLDAYGCKLSREPSPGESFNIILPTSADAFVPIVNASRCTPREYGLPNRAWLEIDATSEEDATTKAETWHRNTNHPWGVLKIASRPVDCGDFWRVELR